MWQSNDGGRTIDDRKMLDERELRGVCVFLAPHPPPPPIQGLMEVGSSPTELYGARAVLVEEQGAGDRLRDRNKERGSLGGQGRSGPSGTGENTGWFLS